VVFLWGKNWQIMINSRQKVPLSTPVGGASYFKEKEEEESSTATVELLDVGIFIVVSSIIEALVTTPFTKM